MLFATGLAAWSTTKCRLPWISTSVAKEPILAINRLSQGLQWGGQTDSHGTSSGEIASNPFFADECHENCPNGIWFSRETTGDNYFASTGTEGRSARGVDRGYVPKNFRVWFVGAEGIESLCQSIKPNEITGPISYSFFQHPEIEAIKANQERLWHPFRVQWPWQHASGGVAALNHRLMAVNPYRGKSRSSVRTIPEERARNNIQFNQFVGVR